VLEYLASIDTPGLRPRVISAGLEKGALLGALFVAVCALARSGNRWGRAEFPALCGPLAADITEHAPWFPTSPPP
jgi:hypothetical protein